MESLTINLPAITTGIALSSGTIELLAHCIANCPLTEKQRNDLNQELSIAIKSAVDNMKQQQETELRGPHNMEKVDGLH